ncbi:MAG: hypothetical protein CVU36_13100 [Betaproteobacteria bacterium HGW-Betaproteobacteria-9]|jgi:hypothetical protein|nr:hypothetical protein [Hydrogenophaga sp.]PKO29155.1 MAG: hypothetical protein CVU36_13100 [Betaproteobacteria bacterium HGW-Betaproteobacteria-9]
MTARSTATGPLSLRPVNDGVFAVLNAQGLHVGNLKRIGAVWKFKAVGSTAQGETVPGGGPLTERHNTVFERPDEAEVSAGLLAG